MQMAASTLTPRDSTHADRVSRIAFSQRGGSYDARDYQAQRLIGSNVSPSLMNQGFLRTRTFGASLVSGRATPRLQRISIAVGRAYRPHSGSPKVARTSPSILGREGLRPPRRSQGANALHSLLADDHPIGMYMSLLDARIKRSEERAASLAFRRVRKAHHLC
jgi:hypothetical protein